MKVLDVRLVCLVLVFTLVIAACSGGETISTTTTTTPSTNTTTPPTTSMATSPTTSPTNTVITKDPLKPPSPEELDRQGFSLPELPRITCEQLKNMMDNKEPLILIDTRVTLIYDMGNIPQSINIPIDMEEIDLIDRLLMLPKDKPVIVYCD